MTAKSAAGEAAMLAQTVIDVEACCVDRRGEPEENTHHDGSQKRICEDRAIDACVLDARNLWRMDGEHCAQKKKGDSAAGHSACGCQDQALGEQLADYPQGGSAAGGADGYFPNPC